MTLAPSAPRMFDAIILNSQNQKVRKRVPAASRADAYMMLTQEGATVLQLSEMESTQATRRKPSITARIFALQKLASLLGAGVHLIEAIDSLSEETNADLIARDFANVASALRQGRRLGAAMREHSPYYPDYVFAFVDVGEETGELAIMIERAAIQLVADDAIQKQIEAALAYPLFLSGAAVLMTLFLLIVVVPQFEAMIQKDMATTDWLTIAIFGLSRAVTQHGALIAIVLALFGALVAAFILSPRTAAYRDRLLLRLPFFGGLTRARRKARWARIMSHALSSNVGLLRSCELSYGALGVGDLQALSGEVIARLRSGKPIEQAFSAGDFLTAPERSLMKVGQRSGTLGKMCALLADRFETDVTKRTKRISQTIEQAAIAFVSIAIGGIVLSLVSSLATVYEGIS